MVLELRKKSQITIPSEIIKELGLSIGDKFEMFVKDGTIVMVPVTLYPKKYVKELEDEIISLKKSIETGDKKYYSNADELLDDLEESK